MTDVDMRERVAAEWLAWPTLSERHDGWWAEDVPPSAGAAGALTGYADPMVMVSLVLSGDPPDDCVLVMVGSQCAGAVPADCQERFSKIVRRLDELGFPATCRARVQDDHGRPGLFVLGDPRPSSERSPFLPPFDEVAVEIDSENPAVLDGFRAPGYGERASDEVRVVRGLGTLYPFGGRTWLSMDGRQVGVLAGPRRSVVTTANERNFPATCTATLRLNRERRMQVAVELPDSP